jgi:hypothetical protein
MVGEIKARAHPESYLELLKRYHECRDIPYHEVDGDIPWSRTVTGLRLGLGLDQFGVYGDHVFGDFEIPHVIMRNEPFQWMPGASLGLNLRFESPRKHRFTSYELGAHYRLLQIKNSRDYLPGTYQESAYQTAGFEQVFHTIALRLSIRRNFFATQRGLYAKGGLGMNLPLTFTGVFNMVEGTFLRRNVEGVLLSLPYTETLFPTFQVYGPNLVAFGALGYQMPFGQDEKRKIFVFEIQPAWEGDIRFAPLGTNKTFSNRNISIRLVTGVDF